MRRPNGRSDAGSSHSPPLGLFGTTSLVVGAVVGADVYVVAASGAQLLGPAAVVAWIVGGVMAIAISMAMAECALALPEAGGSYAYARAAFGTLPGLVVGWCFYFGELLTTAVFPIAFIQYLQALVPGFPDDLRVLTMLLFVAFVTATNYVGARAAGTINLALTVGKLLPLVAIILLGLPWIALDPARAAESVTPFAPHGWASFGTALTLVFWAYAGFEVAPLPAREIRSPRRTLPLALWWGMLAVTALYILLSVVVVAVLPSWQLAGSATPLVSVTEVLFTSQGLPSRSATVLVAVGAILAISSVEESMTLGTTRLAHRLALDGYLPGVFRRESRRFGTPAVAIVFQGAFTFVFALVGSVESLISAGIFYLSLIYLATALAAPRLAPQRAGSHLAIPFSRLVMPLAVTSSVGLVIASAPGAGPLALLGLIAAMLVGRVVARRSHPD